MTQPYETSAIDTATMNDLMKRVAELEERLQEHTGDAQGSAGQFYPHPVQIIDTAEFGGGVSRLDRNGIQVSTGSSVVGAIYWPDQFYGTIPSYTSYIAGYTIRNASGQISTFTSRPTAITEIQNFSQDNDSRITMHSFASGAHGSFNVYLTVEAADDGANGTGIFISGAPLFLGQSSAAAAVANNGTITTTRVSSVARVSPAGAVTGIILQAGTSAGQTCLVVNEAVAANTVTFAASGTSNVADGTSSVIAGLNARLFVWDSGVNLWFPCK